MDRLAKAEFAPQLLFKQLGIVGDHAVGGAQDAGGGTVVLLQLDDVQARKILAQAGQVFDVGTARA